LEPILVLANIELILIEDHLKLALHNSKRPMVDIHSILLMFLKYLVQDNTTLPRIVKLALLSVALKLKHLELRLKDSVQMILMYPDLVITLPQIHAQ